MGVYVFPPAFMIRVTSFSSRELVFLTVWDMRHAPELN